MMVAARCVPKAQAAAYCNVTVAGFDSWVKRGLVPGPLPGTHRWDIRALDAALDRLSGLAPTPPIAGALSDSDGEGSEPQSEVRRRYQEWKRRRDEGRA